MKIEDLKAQFKDEAERQVKTSLTLEQIGKQENIAATDDEVEKEYNNMADLYKLSVDKIKKIVHEDEIKKDIVIRKTVDTCIKCSYKIIIYIKGENYYELGSDCNRTNKQGRKIL